MRKNKYLLMIFVSTFTLSSCKVEEEIKEIKLESLYSWVKDLKEEDIEKVMVNKDLGSISPSLYRFNTHTIANSKEDISKTYQLLKNSKVCETKDLYPCGAYGYHLEITLKNNEEYSLTYFDNIFSYESKYYKFLTPAFEMFPTIYGYSFVYSLPLCFRFFNDNEYNLNVLMPVKDFLSSLVFKEVEKEIEQVDYYLNCGFKADDEEKILIIDDKTFKTELPNNESKIYEIINGHTFSEFVKSI